MNNFFAFLKLRFGATFGYFDHNSAENIFLVMSNARAGSSFFQSTLAAIGAFTDFEFALRPYSEPMQHQRFVSIMDSDIAYELRAMFGEVGASLGSKFTLPIYDYLSNADAIRIVDSCRRIGKPIHLVRNYWDLLKSNLSRGVAHSFDANGHGWAAQSAMHKVYSQLEGTSIGSDKQSVYVNLPEESFKKYLLNLVRNDYIFFIYN